MTTAGSLALEGSIAARDAFIVERLRAAGAVILGKTNMSEWANFRSSHSTSGWSGRGGLVKNPYALDRNPCGSSSGTERRSANFATVGVGWKRMDRSSVPRSNGPGRHQADAWSREPSGIIPSRTRRTPRARWRGPLKMQQRCSAFSGADPRDGATASARRPTSTSFESSLNVDGLRGARIGGRARNFRLQRHDHRIANAAIERMKLLGAVIVDPADIPNVGNYDASELDVLLYEFKTDLNAYLSALGPGVRVHSLADVIAFNNANRDREMPFFGQDRMLQAEKKGPLTEKAYKEALAKDLRLSRKAGIDAVMDRLHLDAVVAPSGNPPWTTDFINGDHFTGSSTTPAAVAGYPSITVPAGFAFGQPVGLSFIGRAWSEALLVKFAYAYEQATRHRRPPTFPPTADLTAP